ncbi:MAG: zf-HC2 domain-containing protein [Planctomycetes bacterium]|nr:zf-HC2 domain-containing protein [Planctomycetota bacterium]
MTCHELVEFLIEYAQGTLDPAVLGAFEHHLNVCPDCRFYLKSYEFTIRIGRASVLGEFDELRTELPEDLVWAVVASRPVAV